MTEAEHLPDRKMKSDADLAIDAFVDDMLNLHPNLDREEFREQVNACVQGHLPDEDESTEEEEEETSAGVTAKAKGLVKEAAGTVVRNEEMKAEGRLEREGGTTEGNRAYFRSVIEETNRRATDRA